MDTQQINLPIEKVVETDFLKALEEHEIRKEILIEQRDECLSLAITDLTDKEKYTLVRQTRLNQKAKRIVIEKVCKAGRENAVLAQKAWIGLEKEFTSIISAGEKHLQEQEDIWDAEEERKKNEKKVLEEKQFSERSNILQNYGAKLIDGYFTLENVSYEAALIRETDETVWSEMMLPKYKSIFDEKETKRIADEKKLAQLETMRTTVYNARLSQLEKENLNISRDELVDMTDADFEVFKDTHNGAIITARKQKEEAFALQQRTDKRKSSLFALGLKYNGIEYYFDTIVITPPQIETLTEEEWDNSIEYITKRTAEIKEEQKQAEEQKQQEAQELANKKAIGKSRKEYLLNFGEVPETEGYFSELTNETYTEIALSAKKKYEDKVANEALEQQKQQQELQRQQQLEEEAKMKDADKWQEFVKRLNEITLPVLKTKKYNILLSIAKEKIEEIVNL